MRITPMTRSALCVVSIVIALGIPAPSSAQDLIFARAESLNEVLDDVAAISSATGRPFSREMVMGMGAGFFGSDPSDFLAMDRPVAAVVPVEGMMMMANGVVVAVPVINVAAAIDAMASQFPNHGVEGELHTFSSEQGPVLYLTAANGYLRVGGSADLVTRIDPLAGAATGSTLSVELFLEPVAPMIEANLGMVKTELMSGMGAETETPYDPAAMEPVVDAYIDSFRWLLANTRSLRVRLDVDDGYVRFAKDLIPKPGGDLAGFIEAQKGGLPKIAKLADQRSAWYMAGQVNLTEEHRQGLKKFVGGYIDIMGSMKTPEAESTDSANAEPMVFWNEYMALFSPHVDRWIDCLRGDMVASFDLPAGKPFQFVEAFGLFDDKSCANLFAEMSDEIVNAAGSAEILSEAFTVAKGPEIGDSETLVMTFDMVKMLDEMGQPSDENAEAMIKAMYGERMSAAMVNAGDVVLVAGGTRPIDRLGNLAAALPVPGKAPSFSPLEVRPGLMFGVNLGAMATWMKNAIPEGAAELESAAERLKGDAGRVPMAVTFASQMATFDMAVSLDTIQAITAIVDEQRAKAAKAQKMTSEGEGD